MATGPASILMLWCLLAPTALTSDPWCEVSCTTDYSQSLNCSCAATPPHAVQLSVRCRDEDGLEVGGACTARPPRSWCLILPPRLEEVTLVGTLCWGAAGPEGGARAGYPQEDWTPPQKGWMLSDVVRPQPPADVRVEDAGDAFNISWNQSAEYQLTYRLRIQRPQKPPCLLEVEEENLRIDHTALPPHQGFVVDVQAKPRQGDFLNGTWSEWSPAAEWRPPDGPPRAPGVFAPEKGMNAFWVYVSLPVVLVLGLLLLGYLHKPFWQKRLKVVTYCPRPDGFFRPLYQSHAGDFKEWVRPAFSEADYLRVDAGVAAPGERQPVLHWDSEGRSLGEDLPSKTGTPPLLSSTPPLPSPPATPEGRVSIHTVTLSGDDLQDPMMMAAGADPEPPAIGFDGPERASLDSFGSNGPSEDGYPHVDLDTIDSGFGEPRSPGAPDAVQTGAGHTGADSFPEHENSNYVKQWMVCGAVREDGVRET